jgi:hypothetical protein
MEILKQIEKELILEWQKLQLEVIPHTKAAAIKAYYVKYRLYRREKEHQVVVSPKTLSIV